MQYIGSKNRLSKELSPIIQSYINEDTMGYIEPFVGGANMIDKIKCEKKIGCDIHSELIALLKQAQTDITVFPEKITEEEYYFVKANPNKFPDWYVGLVGFCGSFGAKWWGGFARDSGRYLENGKNRTNEAIRSIIKQSSNLTDIIFINKSFLDLPKDKIKGYVIYCDIPYRNTTKYKVGAFPYDRFYQWCKEMSKENTVLISEYGMPKEFECIWSKEHKTTLDKNENAKKRMEKLFICR